MSKFRCQASDGMERCCLPELHDGPHLGRWYTMEKGAVYRFEQEGKKYVQELLKGWIDLGICPEPAPPKLAPPEYASREEVELVRDDITAWHELRQQLVEKTERYLREISVNPG